MFAIAITALYTTLRRRGTTRQLAAAIVTCVISALLLLPAFVWYSERFDVEQAALATIEVEGALAYVALWGWLLPLSATIVYLLFTQPRLSTDSINMPRQRKSAHLEMESANTAGMPAQRPLDTPAPFVFGEDTPWGWLVHRTGRFQGLRLALTRTVIRIGREEDNDICLDDDMASRYHAELTWNAGTASITDHGSLNGVLLNGRAMNGSAAVKSGDILEIGSHLFLFEYAEQPVPLSEQDDPLLRHPRSPITPLPLSDNGLSLAATKPLERDGSLRPDIATTHTTPLPQSQGVHPLAGPSPLRLPSRPKKD